MSEGRKEVVFGARAGVGRREMLSGAAVMIGLASSPELLAAKAAPPRREVMNARRAEQFARLALSWIDREYPASPGLSRVGADDPLSPKINHPVFYGGFDWNSSVANHWVLARLLRSHANVPQAARIASRFDTVLTGPNVAAEIDYFKKPDRQGFGRPVGWGYVMMLSTEFARMGTARGTRWQQALQPLVDDLRRRTLEFMPKLRFAGRSGYLPAGFSLMAEYARQRRDAEFLDALRTHAKMWYGTRVMETVPQVGGEDSIPGEWATADLMRRLLPHQEFVTWFDRFAPGVARQSPEILFEPFELRDRTDRRMTLANDLMNVNSGWLLGRLASAQTGARAAALRSASERFLAAGLPHVEDSEYSERALPPPALLALDHV